MPPFLDGIPRALAFSSSEETLPRYLEKDKDLAEVIRAFKRSLQKPTRVVRDFGEIKDDSFHLGIDIYMPIGTAVRCPFKGTITTRNGDEDLGNYVVVSHGKGLYTIYGHLAAFADQHRGDQVEANEVIGYSGITGLVVDESLHFGVLKDGLCLNPEVLLSAAK
jgi:murein DD-endopeptidase MepM/ murein hydrolase activator NlpD